MALSGPERCKLTGHLLAHPGSTGSTLLAAYAGSTGLSVGELSGLLPGMLILAHAAASRLLSDVEGDEATAAIPSMVVPPTCC